MSARVFLYSAAAGITVVILATGLVAAAEYVVTAWEQR